VTTQGGKVIGASAATRKVKTKPVVLGRATVTVAAGKHKVIKISLNAAGRRLLSQHHMLKTKLTITQSVGRKTISVATRTVTFKANKHKR
jgi:hypothetical protein